MPDRPEHERRRRVRHDARARAEAQPTQACRCGSNSPIARSRCSSPSSTWPSDTRFVPTRRCPSACRAGSCCCCGERRGAGGRPRRPCRTRRGTGRGWRGCAAAGTASEGSPVSSRLGQRVRVDLLDLLGVAADRHEPAGEARAQGDLLGGALGRRRRRREHGEQVVRELDGPVVPAAVVVQRPERVEHRVEPLEVAGLDPVAPRGAQVAELGLELGERPPPAPAREALAPLVRERRRSARRARVGRRRAAPAHSSSRSAAYSRIVSSIASRR